MDMVKSIELFSGTGGLALGLHQSGFSHSALYELDLDSCRNLWFNSELGSCSEVKGWNVLRANVCDVDFSKFESKISLVAGGPPCQPFSIGGKSRAYNDKRDMFPQAVRAVRESAPKAFVFENVKGLLRKSFATYFNYILLQLTHPCVVKTEGMSWEEHLAKLEAHHTSKRKSDLQYNVTFRLVNAADYGIPQSRHRVVIVGFRSDMNVKWSFPAPTHSKDSLAFSKWVSGEYWEKHGLRKPACPLSNEQLDGIRKACESSSLLRWQTVRDAFSGLPEPYAAGERNAVFKNHESRGTSRSYVGHTGSLLDEPSKTIKAGAHGVPGGENTVVLDDGTTRYYTVRESARIQTFPDDFVFASSWTESMRQIGNAVPVKLGKIIGSSIIGHLR